MNYIWWQDLGGWLGRGTSWTALDFISFIVLFPLCVWWIGIRAGLWWMRIHEWQMDLPYEQRKRAKKQ